MPLRPVAARIAAAALALGLALLALAPASPAAARATGNCDTKDEPTPLWAPHGTTWYLHHAVTGDTGVAGSATTLEQDLPGQPAEAKTLGALPAACVLDGLSYNAKDGYLYALASPPGAAMDVPLTSRYRTDSRLVRIGVTDGKLAAREVATLPTGGDNRIRAVLGQVADMDEDGQLLVPQVSLGARGLPALALNKYRSDGGLAASTPMNWSGSCDAVRDNYLAQYMLWLATGRRGPIPPTLMGDWSYRPDDKHLYAYVSAEAHDAYVDKLAYVPTGLWQVRRLGDQVLRVSVENGAIDCAAIRGSDSGAVAESAGETGTAPMMGTAFHGDGETLDLYQTRAGDRWVVKAASCFTADGCAPEKAASGLPGAGRAHGDAAANLGSSPLDLELHQGDAKIGDLEKGAARVTLRLRVRNNGPHRAAAGYQVVDVPGDGLKSVRMSGKGFDCKRLTCVARKPLGKGKTAELTVRASARRGQYSNVAYVVPSSGDVESDRPTETPTADTDASGTDTNNDDRVVVRVIDTIGRYVGTPLAAGAGRREVTRTPEAGDAALENKTVPVLVGMTGMGVVVSGLVWVLAFSLRPRD